MKRSTIGERRGLLPSSVWRSISAVLALIVMGLVGISGCATRTVMPYEPPAPEYAQPPPAQGVLAELEAIIASAHGPDTSGFKLLDGNEDALRWRLALIDTAQSTIDAQYYLWYGDSAGRLLIKRLFDAASRGVRVRLLVDDLNTMLRDAGTVVMRDDVIAWVDAHPNIELRLFNPWTNRNLAGRLGEAAADFKRINQRMHNKALIIDNRAVIVGGRNIGDEYMGLNTTFNFHDLDVLGIGPLARQTSEMFDSYWNSGWVMPVSALGLAISQEELDAGRAQMLRLLHDDALLSGFAREPRGWTDELHALSGALQVGTSSVITDVPTEAGFDMLMLEQIRSLLASAQSEVLIVNAYIIPTEEGISILEMLKERGVTVKVLTNSLASHDVPAVNSHYRPWRKPILEAGAELYELRHDAELKASVADTPPVEAGFVGLHSKAMIVDGRYAFIGSMNYDPRSALLNTEMGAIIDSPALAAEAVSLIERDIQPANSWQVSLDDRGKLIWTNDQEVVTRQPARNFWQRVEDVLFSAIPKEYY